MIQGLFTGADAVAVDKLQVHQYGPRLQIGPRSVRSRTMKVKNSLKSLKSRHRDCRVIRRKGRVYVINKTQKRFKARQG